MGRKRNRQRHPVIGGVVGEDKTKQARVRQAKKDVAEMAEHARKKIKLPTQDEVKKIGRTN